MKYENGKQKQFSKLNTNRLIYVFAVDPRNEHIFFVSWTRARLAQYFHYFLAFMRALRVLAILYWKDLTYKAPCLHIIFNICPLMWVFEQKLFLINFYFEWCCPQIYINIYKYKYYIIIVPQCNINSLINYYVTLYSIKSVPISRLFHPESTHDHKHSKTHIGHLFSIFFLVFPFDIKIQSKEN